MYISDTCFDVIKNLLDLRDENDQETYYTELSQYVPSTVSNIYELYLLPNIIIWDPLKQLTTKLQLFCPHCAQNNGERGSFLKISNSWETGQSNALRPRVIWDSGWFCALVGRVYTCPKSHRITSYHFGVLEQLSTHDVPFILFHGTGMTFSTFEAITRLIEAGQRFIQIEKTLGDCFTETFNKRREACCVDGFPAIKEMFKLISPTNDIIKRCFVRQFERNKWMYTKDLENVKCQCLVCFFTENVGLGVGTMAGKKWVKEYHYVFVVMNEIGEVKFSQITKTLDFEEVSEQMELLSHDQENVTNVLTDRCCTWHEQLVQLFPNAQVLGIISSELKRLKDKIPKKYQLLCEEIEEIKTIFESTDSNNVVTSAPLTLLLNLEAYVTNIASGHKAVSHEFINGIENLKSHILRGCFSNIPLGLLQHPKDAIEDALKSLFSKFRYGLETANALTYHLVYARNCALRGHEMAPFIWNLEGYDVFETCNYVIDPASLYKHFSWRITMETNVTPTRTILNERDILILASAFCKIDECLSSSELFLHQPYPAICAGVWKIGEFFYLCKVAKHVNFVLFATAINEMGLQMVLTARTAANSFLIALYELLKLSKILWPEDLLKIDVHGESFHVLQNIKRLLHEELKISKDYYSPLVDGDYDTLIEKFNTEECCSQQIATLLSVAAANIFKVPVVIVTLRQQFPVLVITPKCVLFDEPLFFLYHAGDNGHFDALAPKSLVSKEKPANVCSCGSNDKTMKRRCTRTFRCKCSREGRRCTVHCRCKGCKNKKVKECPLQESTGPVARRKRTLVGDSPMRASHQFMLQTQASSSPWLNPLQHFILEATLSLLLNNIEVSFGDIDDVELSLQLYALYEQMYTTLCRDSDCFVKRLRTQQHFVSQWILYRRSKTIELEDLKKQILSA